MLKLRYFLFHSKSQNITSTIKIPTFLTDTVKYDLVFSFKIRPVEKFLYLLKNFYLTFYSVSIKN